MSDFVNYKGMQILATEPINPGGQAIQANAKYAADQLAALGGPPQEITTGIVAAHGQTTNTAYLSTGIISYTVTPGKTLYLRGANISSSGGPCKIVIDVTAATGPSTPQILEVAFYSSAVPSISIQCLQPVPIAAGTVVNVRITNFAGSSQDLYSTLYGREI